MKPHVFASISGRLLLSSLLVSSIFLGLTGLALDAAHRSKVETALNVQLENHVYTLLSAAGEDARGRLLLPDILAAPDFNLPDSGLYAQVDSIQANYQWRSGSMLGQHELILQPSMPASIPGQPLFSSQQNRRVIHYDIAWEDINGETIDYNIAIALDLDQHRQQLADFRSTLWRWLGGSGLLLLVAQLLLLRWGLAPLRQLARQVRAIEDGEAGQLNNNFPGELRPLANNLNSLIRQNQHRQERLRNGLADLAHSLKTPLAVLRGAADAREAEDLPTRIREQTDRIDQIVQYQHQRTAIAGSNPLATAVALLPLAQRIGSSLGKVYRDRHIDFRVQIPEDLTARADAGDLFELLGNLLDNAFKHARSSVLFEIRSLPGMLEFRISDDGPGIAKADRKRVLERWQRADQRNPGQGIGLAVVHEIVDQYDGTLEIGPGPLGGAQILITLPQAF